MVTQKANTFFKMMQQYVSRSTRPVPFPIVYYSPQAPHISKIRDRYRMQISIKSIKGIDPSSKYINDLLRCVIGDYSRNNSDTQVRVRVDIDAYE